MHTLELLAAESSGFLPTRGSVMLDFVFVAMFVVSIAMVVSVAFVRILKKYRWHKWMQIALATTLVVAVMAFEVDMRFFTDWRELAEPSPYFDSGVVHGALAIHLLFAIPTPFFWGGVIFMALRRFDRDPSPNEHSARNRRFGWISLCLMLGTAVTGWIFYGLAFVA